MPEKGEKEEKMYAMMHSTCHGCKQIFSANPTRVPSMRINDQGEQVSSGGRQVVFCQNCMNLANNRRKDLGIDVLFVHPDAYEPVHESEF